MVEGSICFIDNRCFSKLHVMVTGWTPIVVSAFGLCFACNLCNGVGIVLVLWPFVLGAMYNLGNRFIDPVRR